MSFLEIQKILGIDEEIKPKFQLKKTGDDDAQNEGLEWIYLLCPYCKGTTKFIPIHTISIKSDDEFGDVLKDHHSLAKCENCNDIIYIKCWEVDMDPDWHFCYEYHHPRIILDHSIFDVPQIVFTSFKEANICLNAGAYLATLVMCRRTVEGILQDKGVDKTLSLAQALKNLSNESTLHESMIQIAEVIRLFGNIGAHSGDSEVEESQAKECYNFTEQLIDILYVVPQKTKDIKDKLVKKSS